MRTTIHNLIEAKKAEREENGEAGFSLIELIVVVVIIGILAAVAIPIFAGVQASARQSAVDSAASNGAIAASGVFADPTKTATDADAAVQKNATSDITLVLAGDSVESVCVTATWTTGGHTETADKGQGCTP